MRITGAHLRVLGYSCPGQPMRSCGSRRGRLLLRSGWQSYGVLWRCLDCGAYVLMGST